MENIGFLAAIGAALAWGSYMVPFKKSGGSSLIQFQAWMGIGIGVSGLLISLVLNYPLSLNPYGLLSGILWGSANAISLIAVLNLGLAKAVPVMTSLVVAASFLWGTLIFHEITAGLLTGFIGIGLIILGIIAVSVNAGKASGNTKKGWMAAVLAGLIFGGQLVPLKLGNVSTRDFFFPVCLGVFFIALVLLIAKRIRLQKKAAGSSLFSGVIWNIGNLLSIIAISFVGLSKGQPISMSSTLVAVVWGLFYFKEIKKFKQKIQVLIGALVFIGGVIVLGFS